MLSPAFSGPHPQHATSVLIDGHNGVTVEAIRAAFIVLKQVRETLRSSRQNDRDPVSMAPTIHSRRRLRAAPSREPPYSCGCQRADSTSRKWVSRQALCLWIIFHEPDNRGIGQQPQIAAMVSIHTLCAEVIPGCRRRGNLSCLCVHIEETALANK